MDQQQPGIESGEQDKGGFIGAIREIIFGAEDGLVSILGLVTGVAAGSTRADIVFLAGVAGALSGAVSMAAGDYLGVKSRIEVLHRRLGEERRRVREEPQEERRELADFYRERGFTDEEVQTVVPAVMRNRDFLMEEMSLHELGICPGELSNPVSNAFWMFLAYVLAAAFPVLPYTLFSLEIAMTVSIVGTIAALFALGAAKTRFTERNWARSGLEMLVIAAAAGILGYLAGRFVAPAGVTV